MQLSDIPRRFAIPFASGAGADYVRDIPKDHVDATSTDAPASLQDGFPPETFVAIAAGGIPPSGADFNGLLKQITAWNRWQAADDLGDLTAEVPLETLRDALALLRRDTATLRAEVEHFQK